MKLLKIIKVLLAPLVLGFGMVAIAFLGLLVIINFICVVVIKATTVVIITTKSFSELLYDEVGDLLKLIWEYLKRGYIFKSLGNGKPKKPKHFFETYCGDNMWY
jgi:hypothetical protein